MSITLSHKTFLLGGYDLEMLTIKQMLEDRKDCVVIDKHLRWDNARLSVYQNELRQYPHNNIYGIELQEDIVPPANYHRIDHHNDWDGKPSVLEQVSELLGVPLSRDLQLVAANDKGYIPAMKAMGATDDEISDIRQRDRAAQGVTAEEEIMAELSVNNNLSRFGNLFVVKSVTSRFSPICDRLFPYDRLLIYTDYEWAYYGEGKAMLVKRFANDVAQRKVFHGGGKNGFIGSVRNVFSKAEIEQIVEQMIKEYGNI